MYTIAVRLLAAALNFLFYVGFGALLGYAGWMSDTSPQDQVGMALFGGVVALTGVVNIVLIGITFRVSNGVRVALRAVTILINAVWAGFAVYALATGSGFEIVVSLCVNAITVHAVFLRPPPPCPKGTCPTCGYDLAGLPSMQCPECGKDARPEQSASQRESPDERT